jgi:MYXO-CTERM domain-containing protein
VLPAPPLAVARARSRVLYLNHDGVILRPGDNDSSRQVSSIVTQLTAIDGWNIDDDTWAETVACVAGIYAPFDVTVTDEDPGDTPHIEAVFGGHPSDVGLPDNVAGVSPFTSDCGIIEGSIVFAFTDVLPDDPRTVCEVIAQEIAHSYGLDHEMLPSDPMTYLDYAGERTFQDELASCGEYADRPCGINGTTCRRRQNSVELLAQRLGTRGGGPPDTTTTDRTTAAGATGGCSTGGGGAGAAMALAVLGARRRRRR